MHRLRKILREIHRRSLWQVLGIYLVGSWGVFQVVGWMVVFVGLPEWTLDFTFVLLLLGLPVVTATAFVQEGLPGLRGEYRDEVDPNELEGLTPEQVHVDPGVHPLYTARILTWRNAALGGVGAGALLVGSVVAYFGMWAAGVGPMGSLAAQGLIAQGDAVLVADFTDAAGEGLGEVVTLALRVDLSQAELLRVVQGAELRDAMARLRIPEGIALSAHVAREAAVHEGIEVVLDGGVAGAGAGYVITAALRRAGSGLTLASFRSVAVSSGDVIPAIARLSRDIREKSGESLRSIRAGEPPEALTTDSLEALRLYVQSGQALGVGEEPRAIALLDRAVGVDPGFALAWRRLAVVYGDAGLDPGRMVEAATEAYRHRARLTQRERYLAEAGYFGHVEQDLAKTIVAYQNVLRVAPDDPSALKNLGALYEQVGDTAQAVEAYRRLVDRWGGAYARDLGVVSDARARLAALAPPGV
ncbi:MAG TPA: tetratricopeptide repeat protein [Longimicrobiales bacterium]|nr:tetratricopeptide repeat protein [Longimicrobiales bacterium]